jgi:hypothetical protein
VTTFTDSKATTRTSFGSAVCSRAAASRSDNRFTVRRTSSENLVPAWFTRSMCFVNVADVADCVSIAHGPQSIGSGVCQ